MIPKLRAALMVLHKESDQTVRSIIKDEFPPTPSIYNQNCPPLHQASAPTPSSAFLSLPELHLYGVRVFLDQHSHGAHANSWRFGGELEKRRRNGGYHWLLELWNQSCRFNGDIRNDLENPGATWTYHKLSHKLACAWSDNKVNTTVYSFQFVVIK